MLAGGPWFDSAWERIAYLQQAQQRLEQAKPAARKAQNAPERVLWDLGILLAVPLTGAAFVCVVLNFLHVY
jgi:hypothetical protein